MHTRETQAEISDACQAAHARYELRLKGDRVSCLRPLEAGRMLQHDSIGRCYSLRHGTGIGIVCECVCVCQCSDSELKSSGVAAQRPSERQRGTAVAVEAL